MPYLKINHDDSKPIFEEIDLPEEPRAWLDSCYNILGCSTIETVSTILRGVVLVVDGEGKLFDGWQNRINTVASILYGSRSDSIVGDAILARLDRENLIPLTSCDIERLYRHFKIRFLIDSLS